MKSTIGLNFNNFDIKYRPIVTKAVEYMEDVVYHPVFLEILKDEIEKSNGLEGELSDWKDALPVQIYAQMLPIILYLNTYYTIADVIGYGTASDKQIYINTKYLSTYKIDNMIHLMMIGSNILHEDTHDKGFEHDYKATDRRKNSLSYIINRVYQRSFRKIYNLPEPVPVILKYTPWYRKVIRTVRGWF